MTIAVVDLEGLNDLLAKVHGFGAAGVAASVQLFTFAGFVLRMSVREATGTTAAKVNLWDGSNNGGLGRDVYNLNPNESARDIYAVGQYQVRNGLFLEVVSGTVDIRGTVLEVFPGQ